MQISATSYTNGSTATAAAGQDLSGISGEDFMSILIKQLELQDPFEPMTNQEMIAQMSTIRELEMNTRLAERLEQITDQQGFASASGLIGKQITGTVTDSAGNEYGIEGLVKGVEFTQSGEVLLQLDSGLKLPISGVQEIADQGQTDTSDTWVGRYVKGTAADSGGITQQTEGLVTGVEFDESGDLVLRLDDGLKMPITGVQQVANQEQFDAVTALIGKYVTGTATDLDGQTYSARALVTGVEFDTSGGLLLRLDGGLKMRLAAVQQVSDLASSSAE
ncbi:MAG: hypothetical protein GX616_21385 [Planctomycetes bacterium]|nr:hypothetical protein [Planctomycetota bacterium]